MLIQSSKDLKEWDNVCDPIYDYSRHGSWSDSPLYTLIEEDISEGTYFRILILRECEHLGILEELSNLDIKDTKDMKIRKCFVEYYGFYIHGDTIKDKLEDSKPFWKNLWNNINQLFN